jgi:hypothetical protein
MVVASSIEAPLMMMQRDKGLAVASFAFALCATSTASAQKGDSSRAGIEPRHSERALNPRSGLSRAAADSLPTSSSSGWKYPLYGTLIGAGVGFSAAFIATHQRHVKDHSEDGLVYEFLTSFGAVAGFVGGFVLYAMRGH